MMEPILAAHEGWDPQACPYYNDVIQKERTHVEPCPSRWRSKELAHILSHVTAEFVDRTFSRRSVM